MSEKLFSHSLAGGTCNERNSSFAVFGWADDEKKLCIPKFAIDSGLRLAVAWTRLQSDYCKRLVWMFGVAILFIQQNQDANTCS